jgi:ActR/RegA family two-component response regulator/8-oxo-dGTP pyrophosphatase MutT (NUDIX family)
MLPERAKRILLAEDDSLFYKPLLRILPAKGYLVTHVETAEDALVQLYYNHFHVLILDMWLNGGRGPVPDQDNGEGVEVLERIRAGILNDTLTRIILSNYPDFETLTGALGRWGVFQFVRKYPKNSDEEDYITRLLRELDAAFDTRLSRREQEQQRINHSLKLDLIYQLNCDQETIPGIVEHIMREEKQKLITEFKDYAQIARLPGAPGGLSPEALALQVYDLLDDLFFEEEQIYTAPLTAGLTGAAVIRARPSQRSGGVGQQYVVKIGRRDKIEREFDNYTRFVERRFTGGAVTAVMSATSRNLGAIRYRFAENYSGAELREFDVLYNNPAVAPQLIANSLRMIFTHTFRLLHSSKQQDNISIPEDYYKAFELDTEDKGKLKRIVDEIQSNEELKPYLPNFDPQAEKFALTLVREPLLNPIWWLERHKDWSVIPAYRGVTHGDFTGRNIMADHRSQQEQVGDEALEYYKLWLIDFYRTGESHILRDHVIFESDLKYRLLERLSTPDFLLLERILLNPQLSPPDLEQNYPDIYRALVVLGELRDLARELQGTPPTPNDQVEFLLALLMATLNVVRLKHIRPLSRLHALLSASLICSHISYLKTGYASYPEPELADTPETHTTALATIKADYRRLYATLASGKLVLFIGRHAGEDPDYPAPAALMRALTEEIGYTPAPTDTHRLMASSYCERFGRARLEIEYIRYYDSFPTPPVFEKIASFPWAAIYTTNQHTYLEAAYHAAGQPLQVAVEPGNPLPADSLTLHKVYGCLSEPHRARCPLTEEDYHEQQNVRRTQEFQSRLRAQLGRGWQLLMLYPSLTDIRTVQSWMSATPNLRVAAAGSQVSAGDLRRMRNAGIQHLDVHALELLAIFDQIRANTPTESEPST